MVSKQLGLRCGPYELYKSFWVEITPLIEVINHPQVTNLFIYKAISRGL